MKSVILDPPPSAPSSEVFVSQTTPRKYYGVQFICGLKGFIFIRYAGQAYYRNIFAQTLSPVDGVEYTSIKDIIISNIKNSNKVFEFDTTKKLFSWLAEE